MNRLKYVILIGLLAIFLFSIFATSKTGFAQENKPAAKHGLTTPKPVYKWIASG